MMNRPSGMRLFTFSPSEVAAGRGYAGMLLSHFSHGDGMHLLFNMITLFYFGPEVEYRLGTVNMLLIYVAAGVLSTVVVYDRHRAEPEYRALGASDSISGILFAAIVLVPQMDVSFIFVPIPIPAPVFAVAYVVLSTYFMRRGGGRLSHEAHLAGAFAGLILAGLLSSQGFGPLIRRFQSFLS
jgi:membrane associated rhomboid family serine protease